MNSLFQTDCKHMTFCLFIFCMFVCLGFGGWGLGGVYYIFYYLQPIEVALVSFFWSFAHCLFVPIFIFFLRTTGPISYKLGKDHAWIKWKSTYVLSKRGGVRKKFEYIISWIKNKFISNWAKSILGWGVFKLFQSMSHVPS